MRKAIGSVLVLAVLILSTASCTSVSHGSQLGATGSQVNTNGTATAVAARGSVAGGAVHTTASDAGAKGTAADLANYSDATTILLGDAITVDGPGASVSGTTVNITAGGAYSIGGTLDNGQIIVAALDKGTVTLILHGVDITCSTSAPVYVVNAKKAVIVLADGTENYITDGESYVVADPEANEPNAAIFSKSDLTISGSGSLTVAANYKNGITSKDDLEITGGNITVDSAADGIRGRDSVAITDGHITIKAAGDGLRSNNDEGPERGLISIDGGTLDITAGEDAIQAETRVIIRGGNITLSSGGGSANSSNKIGSEGNNWGNWGTRKTPKDSNDTVSAKGIKGSVDVTIEGGTINIDSSDDSIHSNGSLTISGGNITIASGDDGIHSDSTLAINGGRIEITKSYEGIESAAITINEGYIRIVASDDGINAAGGNDGSSVDGRPGQNRFDFSGNNHLEISGGYIAVDATGDGLDINGPVSMTGGVLIVSGPTRNDNGALDYGGSFKMTGGFLVAAGSAGMAQAPDTSSSQYVVMMNFPSPLAAGTMFHIETEKGEEILTFVPLRQYQSVVLCSPDLRKGSTYTVYSGGSSTGTVADGLYSGGSYTVGTQVARFAISSIVTGIGSFGGGMRGGGRRG